MLRRRLQIHLSRLQIFHYIAQFDLIGRMMYLKTTKISDEGTFPYHKQNAGICCPKDYNLFMIMPDRTKDIV